MKKLYFIRHGLSEMNKQGLLAGRTETPLTSEGRKQAKQAGELAKKLNINCIVSSPLSRAHETAKIIAREIKYPVGEIKVNRLFVERDFGSLEGKPWSPDLDLDGFSDIETKDSLAERAHLAYNWLNTLSAENVLVISHGALGRALRYAVQGDKNSSKERLVNGEIHNWL